jgi:phosphorylcholine metabolism protein LicD
MKNDSFHLRLSTALKAKLIRDSALSGFATPTAYLQELIDRGLPLSKSIDMRLQEFEKNLDTELDNLSNKVKDMHKQIYLVYKVAARVLVRSFYIKPGSASENDLAETNSILESDFINVEKKFREE